MSVLSVLCEWFKLVQLLNIQADLSPDKLQPCRSFANDEKQEEKNIWEKERQSIRKNTERKKETDGKNDKIKETKTRKKMEEGKNRNGVRMKKEWKKSDSVVRHRSSFTTATENHVKANYGDMKKWKKKFCSFGKEQAYILE